MLSPASEVLAAAKKRYYYTPSAVKGADEKNFVNPATRCLTAAMKSLNASNIKRMKADIAAAEKRLGKKFDDIPAVPTVKDIPALAAQAPATCSASFAAGPNLCINGQPVSGTAYAVAFSGFSGIPPEWITISPKYDGVSSPSVSIQSASTQGASGIVTLDGLSVGAYTAYAFASHGGARPTAPSISVDFTVLPMDSSTLALLAPSTSTITTKPDPKTNPAELYKEKMDTVWAAMSQPYCGYGSRGIAAVKKSYIKSVERIRAEFLKNTGGK